MIIEYSAGIARKWGSDSLKYVNTTRLLREDEPIQFLIEITNGTQTWKYYAFFPI